LIPTDNTSNENLSLKKKQFHLVVNNVTEMLVLWGFS